ncbi:hypothetical protein IKG10_01665 [Candidatus Saccharibacteria bacterium]|nr:hypothetical protein [Candidatus Saccharibacteria bacterium]
MKLKKDYSFWIWIGGAMLFLIAISVFVIISNINNKTSVPASTESTTQPNTSSTDSFVDTSANDLDSSNNSSSTPEPESLESRESEPELPQKTESQTYTTPSTTPSCYHEEDGRCWDDLEDEAYSAGLYDNQFGYYGATLEYAEDCNALCREIIEDAYDEGYADGM